MDLGKTRLLVLSLALMAGFLGLLGAAQAQDLNPNPPDAPVRLVFIHHSVGEDLLRSEGGDLRQLLNDNNYYVTDTNYGWGPVDNGGTIGDHTDIGHWYNWFLGPQRATFLSALYTNRHLTDSLRPNAIPRPPGRNTVVIFKSCFLSAQNITGNRGAAPRRSSAANPNPIWGRSSEESEYYTVRNIKGLYRDLLKYFAKRQDRLFILFTTPPSIPGSVGTGSPARARALHTWLVHHWLDNYPHNNVAVFDFFNVLTSNGGGPNINDLGDLTGNHHRFRDGQVEHVIGLNKNYLKYRTPGPDNHPSPAGDQKAAAEFIPLLNIVYHYWQGTGGRPSLMGRE